MQQNADIKPGLRKNQGEDVGIGERDTISEAGGTKHPVRFYGVNVDRDTGEVYGAFDLDDGRRVLAVTSFDAANDIRSEQAT
ncbi:MAG: hypothetical protein K2W81_11200 [Sphingomonas sp.]|uniref:hypothetical protein n=1 Tax=Sphingomonas sp. TaxID=28214 RepID=UPI0025DC7133|nr:hypothetical protein [Sphingomonas sp.]MBY0284515.1 hypothetical protein [Sphingomonas sp.]